MFILNRFNRRLYSFSIGMQGLGYNHANPTWLGFSYGSWLPRQSSTWNPGARVRSVGGYWLCFHFDFTDWGIQPVTPSIWKLESLVQHARDETLRRFSPVHGWQPHRPAGYPSWRERLKATWLVLRGKADAVVWPGDQ